MAAALVVVTLATAAFVIARPAFAQDETVWSATLNVQAINVTTAGCQQGGATSNYCSDTDNLSEDEFIVNGVTYTVTHFYNDTGPDLPDILFKVDPKPENEFDGMQIHLVLQSQVVLGRMRLLYQVGEVRNWLGSGERCWKRPGGPRVLRKCTDALVHVSTGRKPAGGHWPM